MMNIKSLIHVLGGKNIQSLYVYYGLYKIRISRVIVEYIKKYFIMYLIIIKIYHIFAAI